MTREAIIKKTIQVINKLPEDKVAEISDFADFVLNKFEEQQLKNGVNMLNNQTKSFDFLYLDEDLYSEADLLTNSTDEQRGCRSYRFSVH